MRPVVVREGILCKLSSAFTILEKLPMGKKSMISPESGSMPGLTSCFTQQSGFRGLSSDLQYSHPLDIHRIALFLFPQPLPSQTALLASFSSPLCLTFFLCSFPYSRSLANLSTQKNPKSISPFLNYKLPSLSLLRWLIIFPSLSSPS